MNTAYTIGGQYKYPNGTQIFILSHLNAFKNVFKFECGHWVTGNVFCDLILINKPIQLKLFD